MVDRGYYIFWASIALIITTVIAASTIGLQVWLTNHC